MKQVIIIIFCLLNIQISFASKPHLILIVADDLGWNDVSWHNPGVITPNMEKLAREGIILDQSYVLPICSPTRSALMTGRYPFTIGRQEGVISPMDPTGLLKDVTLMPQLLKKEGYSTHVVGKWHLGYCNWDYTPTRRGFDSFNGYYNGAEEYFNHTRSYAYSKDGKSHRVNGYDFRINDDVDLKAAGEYSAYEFTARTRDILRTRESSQPLFLYLPFQSVHAPLQVPQNYSDIYNYIKDENRRTYLGMVTALDEAIGHIIDTLKSTGHYENSVIVFTTDNGGPTSHGGNNFPLRGNKTTLWEGGTRGSAFIHSPLLNKTGYTSHQLIHATDWMATFVHLAGGDLDIQTDGVNQWPALNGATPTPRKEMVYNFLNEKKMKAGIRVGKYKLLLGDPGPGKWTPPPKDSQSVGNEINTHGKGKIQSIKKNHKSKPSSKVNSVKSVWSSNIIWDFIENMRSLSIKTLDILMGRKSTRKRRNAKIIDALDISDLLNDNDLNEKLPLTREEIKYIVENKFIESRLYDLEKDPTERHDLSLVQPALVSELLERLLSYLPKYMPPDIVEPSPAADPTNFQGYWSPGWC